MKKNKNLVASLAVASTIGFFNPLTSHAFGLGNLELKSALNEPFKAEINVTALKPNERDDLQVQMASTAEFNKAGLERTLLLTQLKFDIVEQNGQVKILVTSKDPIKEPFLDFLLTATAGQGQLLREYTVLLDPPEYVMAEVRGRQQPTTTTATAIKEPVAAKESPVSTSYQYPTSGSADSYAVQRSDTLWNIALKTRPQASISVHQMMMALVKHNPDAFTNQNINGLKAGYTLKIPAVNDITALSSSQAVAAVREQNQAWKNRNQRTEPATTAAVAVEKQTEQVETETEVPAVSEPATSTEVESKQPTAAGQDEAHLKLVAPEDMATTNQDASTSSLGSSEVEKLSEQLTLAQETIEAQNQENIDFKLRMEALEEQVNTLTRMLSIRDKDLARLQDLLEEENPELASQLEQEQPEAMLDGEAVDTATVADLPAEKSPEATAATSSELQPDSDSMPTVEPSALDGAAEVLGIEKEELHSLVSQVKQFATAHKLELGVGLAILLVLIILLRRRKKEVTWSEAVGNINDTQADVTDAPLQATAEEIEQNEPSISLEPKATPSRVKTAGELIEQADMFVGYADYVQARTSLEQAHNNDPENRLAIHKLLFVLYKQGQTEAFLELLDDSEIDRSSDEWDEICQWGKELDPDNSLFQAPAVTPVTTSNPVPEETDISAEQPAIAETTITEAEPEEVDHVAFDLNDFASETAGSTSLEQVDNDNEDRLSFDSNFALDDKVDSTEEDTLSIDNLDFDESSTDDIESVVDEKDEDDTLLSFDIDTSEPADNSVDALSLDDVESAQDDLDDLEFELPETETENSDMAFDLGDIDDIDETETKLDLAAAYIDMGDPDGAKSILNEVLVEGSEEQKNRAHSLLDTLS